MAHEDAQLMDVGIRSRHTWFQRAATPSGLLLALGLTAFTIPTMVRVAQDSWSTDQGAHGPIVLATGLWLLSREAKGNLSRGAPGSAVITALLLVPILIIFTLARITSIIEIEGFVMYAGLVTVGYALFGTGVLKRIWFPLIYLLFVFPPPNTLFAMITQPLKIAVSSWAVDILYALGYPIAGSGVTIQIGQYQMLVAAACAGLNSLISLSAIGLFYSYIRYNSNWRYMIVLICAILPIAVFANFVRVVALVLVTFYLGEAAGQGFIHELAGMTMFMSALIGIIALDWIASPLRQRLSRRPVSS